MGVWDRGRSHLPLPALPPGSGTLPQHHLPFLPSPQFVGDEDESHAKVHLEFLEKGHDVGLCRDIQNRSGIVCNEKTWIASQSHGNRNALAHAAAQSEGIGIKIMIWVGKANPLQHVDTVLTGCLFIRPHMQLYHFRNLVAHGMDGAKRVFPKGL